MSENKTQATGVDPKGFIQGVENRRRREDAFVLLEMFNKITGWPPVVWGDSIIGYGQYTYRLANGKTSQFMRTGFSPRKQNLSLYIMSGMQAHDDLMAKLGKFKTSKACLYVNKLTDVDLTVLGQLIQADINEMAQKYPE